MTKKKRKKKRKRAGLLEKFGPFNIFVVALAVAYFAQSIIFNGGKTGPGMLLFFIAAFIFIIAEKVSKKGPKEDKLDKKIEIAMLVLMVITAVFFRVYMIDEVPTGCYRDEGQNGLEAINIMNGVELEGTTLPVYIERWTQNAALYMYFISVSFKLFGIGVLQIRLVSIIFGILV